jgi:ATP-dependent RNA helicase DeaD
VADLRALRLEALQTSLRETIVAGQLDAVRIVVETLAGEFDIMDVAAAAVKQLAAGKGDDVVEEIPSVVPGKKAPIKREVSGARERLFIGGGRKLKIRPGDIVGAIVAHTSLGAKSLGSIVIQDRHSLIDVPAASAKDVVEALQRVGIKGKKLLVRRDAKR